MPVPIEIEVQQTARALRVVFDDGVAGSIGIDRLRDASPAANGTPPAPSSGITITDIAQVGNYAIKPTFSDGHDSGIYGWDLLYTLATTP